MKTETCSIIKSSPWTAEKQAVNVQKPSVAEAAEDALEIKVLASRSYGSHTDSVVQHFKENNCAQ